MDALLKIALFMCYFVFAILLNSVGSAILQVQVTFNATEREASLLEVFEDASLALVSLLSAPYILRIGYKRAMLGALVVVAVACVVVPVFRSLVATMILFVVIGSTFAVVKMSVFGMIGLIATSQASHVSLMNFLEAFFMVGIVSSYFLISAFLNPMDATSASWLLVFFVVAGLIVVVVVIVLCTRFGEEKLQNPDTMLLPMIRKMVSLLKQPLILVYIICIFLYLLIEQSFMSWLPSYNAKVLHLSSSLSIQMSSILAGATALGRFLAGMVMMRLRWHVVLVVCLLSIIVVIVAAIPFGSNHATTITHLRDVPGVAFVFPLIGVFLAPLYPALNSLILVTLPVEQHSLMSGLIVIFSALGGAAGSFLTGNLFQSLGGKYAFYVLIGPIVIMLVSLLVFKKLIDHASSKKLDESVEMAQEAQVVASDIETREEEEVDV
jgi:FHS family glucose/mannose:H+ symporter-like MFS transporter